MSAGQLQRTLYSNETVKVSYVCGCSVALTHGLLCVHITCIAHVFSEFILNHTELRDRLDIIFVPLTDLFSPYWWRGLRKSKRMVQVEREISFNIPFSGIGVDDADTSFWTLHEEPEWNARYHDFHWRENRIYRLAETMDIDTLEHIVTVYIEHITVPSEDEQSFSNGSNISGNCPLSLLTLMAVMLLKGEHSSGQTRRRRRG